MHRVYVLGIPFDVMNKKDALGLVLFKLEEPLKRPFFIATPNPEMLLAARKNEIFKQVLQQTDLNIADGVGILFASKISHQPLPERITGVDLMLEICKKVPLANSIFLLGAAEGVAELVKQKLEKERSGLKIAGTISGSPDQNEEKYIVQMINNSEAKILFVAFGAPKQELWLARNINQLKYVKIVMGVGGAFDFIAGKRKRAPRWMQKIGLEWLFRLIQEPSRVKRIYHATIKFPVVFLKDRLTNKS